MAQVLVIRAARAFDGEALHEEPSAVVLRDGVIESFGPGGAVAVPEGARVLDFPGGTLLPGLVDSHVHVSRDGEPDYASVMLRESSQFQALKSYAHAKKDLAAGVTTVRTAGEKGAVDIALKQAIERGLVEGPRLRAAGQVLCVTGGHRDGYYAPDVSYEGNSVIVNGADEVRRAVREQIKLGADWVKLIATGGLVSPTEPGMQQMSEEEMAAATTEAHRLGRRVSAHAYGDRGMRALVQAGIDSIEHGACLERKTFDLMAERGTYLVATLVGTWALIERGPQTGVARFAIEKAKAGWEMTQRSFQAALEAGVSIAAGSDAGGTCCYHGDQATEWALMADLGMRPVEVLASATRVAAELLGLGSRLGRLAPGYAADVVVVQGDPAADIRTLRDVRCVTKEGEIARLEAATG